MIGDVRTFSAVKSMQVETESKLLRVFVASFLWPILFPAALILMPFRRRLSTRLTSLPKTIDVLLMPAKLIRIAQRNRLWALAFGLAMMAPLLVFALLDLATCAFIRSSPSSAILQRPSFLHWLGTDGLGRDILWLIVGGAGTTYEIALLAAIVSLAVGIPVGLATSRRRTDAFVMIGVELIEALPALVWILMLMTLYSFCVDALDPASAARRILLAIRPLAGGLVIGTCVAPRVVRLVRDKLRFFEREDFIALSRAHGVSTKRILWFHILRKNIAPDLLLLGAAVPGLAVLVQINLDYFFSLGSFRVGAARDTTWTQLLLSGEARHALLFFENWWTVLPPSACVILTTVGCLLWGDGLKTLRSRRHIVVTAPARDSVKTATSETTAQVFLPAACVETGLLAQVASTAPLPAEKKEASPPLATESSRGDTPT